MVNDIGADNIERLDGINDPRFDPATENLVALRTSGMDYHFVVKEDGTWYSKPGSEEYQTWTDKDVTRSVWFSGSLINMYNSETIYFTIKKDWDD